MVHVHEEENDARLEVTANVVDNEPLADVVDFDVRVVTRFNRFVALLVVSNSLHVSCDGFVRVPAGVLSSVVSKVAESLLSSIAWLTSGELILTERMLDSTMSSRSQIFSGQGQVQRSPAKYNQFTHR